MTDTLEWEMAPLRETFLLYLTNPEDNAAARRMAALAYQLVLEWMHFPPHEEPMIEAELAAIGRDLRYLERFLLRTVAADPCSGEDPTRERKLTAKARRWACKLGRVAGEIEAALGENRG